MTRLTATLLAAAMAAAYSPALSAQWPLHPKPGVPTGPDGRVNLTAAARRAPDGKPDLSGIWMRTNRVEKPGSAPAGQPPLATMGNIGAGFKEGPPYLPWATELVTKRTGGYDNPDGLCLPQGPGQFHNDPQPREIIQLPHKTLIVHESNYMLRTIYTDGRRLPKLGEPQPYWHGYSVGRWEGDTLVVETNNFRGVQGGNPGDGWLDSRGSPYTDALQMTERFRRVNFGNLHIDVTINDPKAYARPFTVRVEQVIVADGSEMIEFICHENQQFLKMTGRQ
ncbi:MAG: hypothetical protein HYU37_07335 [Acidobacteria bacterium]|nr:hypothetical protein [Acidobacteriota bacterium]